MHSINRHRTIGVMFAIAAAASALPAAAGTTYIIQGGDLGAYYQHLDVVDSAYSPITDATVTINGIVIPHLTGSRYSGTLDAVLNAGDAFTLVAQIGTETVTGTDIVPEPPVITAPLDGASATAGAPLLVEWTSTTDPQSFWISVQPCISDCNATLDGTARSAEISTDGFSTTEPVMISVFAYNGGTFTGPVDPASNLSIRAEGASRTITVLPSTPTLSSSWAGLKVRYR